MYIVEELKEISIRKYNLKSTHLEMYFNNSCRSQEYRGKSLILFLSKSYDISFESNKNNYEYLCDF